MQINLTPDWSVIAIIAIFLVNYLIVRRFLIKPVNEVLTWREEEVRGAEKAYEESMAKFSAATSEMESRVHLAKREAAQVREAQRAEAATYRSELVAKVRGEADGIIQTADAQLDRDVTAARTQIVSESDALARLAAERILGRKLS
jgi:F-type H+-transporting ATPase subunit b